MPAAQEAPKAPRQEKKKDSEEFDLRDEFRETYNLVKTQLASQTDIEPTLLNTAHRFLQFMLANEIKLNGNFKTKVNVGYREDNSDINNINKWETFSMQLDDNLSPWEVRATDLVLSGCDHRYLSYRYGTMKLAEEASYANLYQQLKAIQAQKPD